MFEVAEKILVRTTVERVGEVDGLHAYQALAREFGEDQVYLLETTEGPYRQYVGFGAVLTLSVRRGVIRLQGLPMLCAAARQSMAQYLVGDALRTNPDVWPALRAMSAMFQADGAPDRFRFGFLSYFGYDVARYIEALPELIIGDGDLPDICLVLYQGMLAIGHDGDSELLTHAAPGWPAPATERARAALVSAPDVPPAPSTVPPAHVRDDTEYQTFAETVERCLAHIAAGDIYQVQIGHELTMESRLDPFSVYLRLRERNPSPFMYLTSIDGHTVVGASPELFARMASGTVLMRPIAGTTRRTGTEAGDEAAGAALRADPKEIAEHTMLVDLCRNDIGRICQGGTLEATQLFTIERFSHVLHLVSTVTGVVEPANDTFDVIPALFPAGTMTGAPKVRAMELIEEFENSRRGLYAGALGLVDVNGYVDLALCIRTLIYREGRYRTRASAGIVADSSPEREWLETLNKCSAAYWAVTGEELRSPSQP